MVKIKIDDKELDVAPEMNILKAALENGIYIPHFCYHPRLTIRGSCRMCLVEIEGSPKLEVACATQVRDGMIVHTNTEKVSQARKAVMEFILKNHPIDCPICDQAGECALHDYYMKYDLKPSRLNPKDAKVKKKKAQPKGPTLILDQERCILCGRCVRFMREIGKDECLVIAGRGDHSEITTFPGRDIVHPYSLCLVDICPVGAWTSRDFRFKKRVWFLISSSSICTFCARGCNMWIDSEKGIVYRFRPRENEKINQSWLCDEGRLSYSAINNNRLEYSVLRGDTMIKKEDALVSASEVLKKNAKAVAGLISASATLEEARAFKKLIEGLGGSVFYFQRKKAQDDFLLRCADRDANLLGMKGLGVPLMEVDKVKGSRLVVVLETIYSEEISGLEDKDLLVLSPKKSELTKRAKLSLATASFAESSGTIVNCDGIEQRYYPALPLKGDSEPADELLIKLTKMVGIGS